MFVEKNEQSEIDEATLCLEIQHLRSHIQAEFSDGLTKWEHQGIFT